MTNVKSDKRSKQGPIAEGLTVVVYLLWHGDALALTYKQFAAEIGAPVTEAAVKKWPQRKKFPSDVARLIVTKARDRGLLGLTLEWVLWGEGPRPQKAPNGTPNRSTPQGLALGHDLPALPQESHGQFAAQIAEALKADLGDNEFGQWSSVEMQHTVLWALKDLARRLWVLRFSMGETFKLTDGWAAKIGLPVRPAEQSSDEGGPEGAASLRSRGAGI
jgi:hypothetical protein